MKKKSLRHSLNASYRRRLRHVNLIEALFYIARCSLDIWEQSYSRQRHGSSYRHEKTIRGVQRISEPYNLSILAYLASEIIANARDRRWNFDLGYFNEGVRFVNSESAIVEDFKQTDEKFRGIQVLLSIAYSQMVLADNVPLVNKIGRYKLLFNEIGHQPGTGAIPRLLSESHQFRNGLSITEFMVAGPVAFALALMGGGELRLADFMPVEVGSTVVDRNVLEGFLSLISADPETFTSKMNRRVSENLHYQTLLNPLFRLPIIRVSERYFAPVPQMLLLRATEGIYEDFKESLNSREWETFTEGFGLVFEKYVGYLIENTSSTWRVWSEQTYTVAGQQYKSADFLILDGRDPVMIECKGSSMNKHTKTWMSQQRYDSELDKLAHGIETIARTAKHLKSNELTLEELDVSLIQRWVGIVVTLDEYLQNPPETITILTDKQKAKLPSSPIRDYFFDRCQRYIESRAQLSMNEVTELFPIENLRVMSIDQFEQFLGSIETTRQNLTNTLLGPLYLYGHPALVAQFDQLWSAIRAIEG